MTDERDPLYPNRGGGRPPVSRRRFVAGSMAVGAAVAAGCSEGEGSADTPTQGEEPMLEQRDTVLVFNTGDDTVSVIDVEDDTVVETTHLGLSSSFPSNQYAPELVDSPTDNVWVNVYRGVRALAANNLEERTRVETGSGANWQELTPDGDALVVSAREPAHTNYKVDADPDSDTFGEIVSEIDRTDEGGHGDNDGPGPCDVTVHPDGQYAYVPDIFGDTLTVLDVASFEIETQIDVEPVGDGAAQPWMGTVDREGDRLLVEHNEGDSGTESIWDVTDPAHPEELVRLTNDDGLGERPLTSEISADGEAGYVFTPGTSDVTVIDMEAREVADRIDLGGEAFTGTWDPAHEKLYVPVQTENVVNVIDGESSDVVETLEVGAAPYGATATAVRPDPESTSPTATAAAQLELDDDSGTTYCIGNCACGHEL